MKSIVLQKGQNIDFRTYPIGHKTQLFVKNRSPNQEGEARVKVGWTPPEMLRVEPGQTATLERDWAGVEGNIFNMGRYDIEIWLAQK